jgi:nucleoside-diphosphate-sugar epimerase
MSNRVLVTGASGFIGRHTLQLLWEKGLEVYGLCHNTNGLEIYSKGVQWLKTDLMNPGFTENVIDKVKPDYLLHLAWDIKGDYRKSSNNIDWMNASVYLMHKFSQYGTRAVMLGSCFEYNLSKAWRNQNEDESECKPDTLYGVCKNSLYNMLQQLDFGKMSWAWARPFYIYGPYEDETRLLPTMVKSAMTKTPFNFKYDGNQVVDYTYVEDVAEALVALLMSHATGPFNIASGDKVRIADIATKIESLIDVPKGTIKMGNEQAEPVILSGRIDRMVREIGWLPKIDLDRGLARLIAHVHWQIKQAQAPHELPPVPDEEKIKDEVQEEVRVDKGSEWPNWSEEGDKQ